jgi:alpha-glucoside transport system substrate-binding protein
MAMVAPFTEQTGIEIAYTGTRDLATQITTGIAGGNTPDVAGLPGPGQMVTWARSGDLKPLDDVITVADYRDSSPKGFADLGLVDGKMVGIFTKATVKGLIWYNTKVYTGGVPADWAAVMATDPAPAEALWCVGWESGGDSGWPGTDWIEDIVIRQSGPDISDQWQRGELKWSSPEIKAAFEELGKVLDLTFGGPNVIVGTNFGAAGNPLFTDPPGCLFHHQASFITSFFMDQGGAKEGDFDFFVMPDINPAYTGALTGGGDLFGMFNDTPQARALIQWLVTPQAQQIWAEIGGGYLAANKFVSPSVYPDDASRKSAEAFVNAQTFRYDAGDLMPTPMQRAFFSAMVEFAQNPGNLDSILTNLDSVQADAYSGS